MLTVPCPQAHNAYVLAAAEPHGYVHAQYSLGCMYIDYGHRGITPDYGKARKWLRLAAAQGSSSALHLLRRIAQLPVYHTGMRVQVAVFLSSTHTDGACRAVPCSTPPTPARAAGASPPCWFAGVQARLAGAPPLPHC